ncbi:MAG: glycosyltransferase [Xanthomonadales bacterium]|nr:glycosyltransferase [Xanthomonadales bacterium]
MAADFEVLHLRSSAGLYGAEYVVLGLVPALAALGIDGRLLCLDNQHLAEQPLWRRAIALGVPAERLACRARFDPACVRRLRDLLAAHPRAILHVHDYKSAAYAWLARLGRGGHTVATAHGQFSGGWQVRAYHWLERRLLRRFDAVCIVSAAMAGDYGGNGRTRLVENGVDTARFHPGQPPLDRAALAIPDDARVIGASMRLTAQKSPLDLLEAFARIHADEPHALLVIAGEGPLRRALELRAAELGIATRVRLPGARTDLERFYPLLDLFVLPSRYEGLPLALLEAMACTRPVVATQVGQVPAVLAGLDAECVAPGDVGALTAAMRRALDGPGARPELRRRVIERFSLERMARDYASVYETVWRAA